MIEDKEADKLWGNEQIIHLQKAVELWIAKHGDIQAGEILPSMTKAFRSWLLRIPCKYNKSPQARKMTIDKQIEAANRHDKRERERLGNQCDGGEFSESERDAQIEEILVRRLKHKTVNKHLDVLGSIFKWLNTADIDADVRNPFKGRRFTKKELELLRQDTREAWDTATARRYLEGPAMSGCLSKSKVSKETRSLKMVCIGSLSCLRLCAFVWKSAHRLGGQTSFWSMAFTACASSPVVANVLKIIKVRGWHRSTPSYSTSG